MIHLIAEHECREGEPLAITVNGWSILLARHEGIVYAVVNTCTHANAALSGGRLRRGSILCPLHGARFDIRTGECVGGTYLPLKIFAARGGGGRIEIEVPEEPPSAQFIPVAVA